MLNGRLEGFAFLSPEYEWTQYVASLPEDCLQAIYDEPYRDGRLGDYLEICACRSGKNLECLIGSGIEYNEDQPECAVQYGNIMRPGMCVQFYCSDLEESHDVIRRLHGVITKIDPDCDDVDSLWCVCCWPEATFLRAWTGPASAGIRCFRRIYFCGSLWTQSLVLYA
jgi:hypothetical protein